jgi:IgA Peptidase M64
MALITLQPSADIHLVLEPQARAILQVDVLSHDPAAVTPTSVRDKCTYTSADPAIATVSDAGVLTPKTVGRTFLTVEHAPASGPKTSVVARVWVHQSVVNWWLGNNHASVHVGEADLLLSAYAEFDGGDIVDITGHGYVAFSSLDPGASVTGAGRVTGILPGNDVTIRGTLDGRDRDAVVTVLFPPSMPRLIVEPVRLSGPMEQRRNILFLAEGFTDKSKFVALAKKIVDRLVSSRLHEPYRILRNDVNYWLAFEPSHENGLTPGPPSSTEGNMGMFDKAPKDPGHLTFEQLVRLVGLPDAVLGDTDTTRAEADAMLQALFPAYHPADLEPEIFDFWQMWNAGILQARDSCYGLMYGQRLGDRIFETAPHSADNSWYLLTAQSNMLSPDPRRSPANVTRWTDLFREFLSSLRTKSGATDPNHVIGPRWALDGDDQGLVVFLCNDEAYGAFARAPVYSAAAVDFKPGFSNVTRSGVGGSIDHEPDTSGAQIEVFVATVTHELSHQFFLGDEYEGGPDRTSIVPEEVPDTELNDNLTTRAVAFTGNPPVLDPDRIKWNRLARIVRASRLAGPVVDGPGANVLVPLPSGEGKRWKAGESVLLRTRNLNAAARHSDYPAYRRHPMRQRLAQVEAVAGDVVTVSGGKLPTGWAFPAGSTLCVPKLNKAGTDVLRVVLPGVGDFMRGPPPAAPRPVFDKEMAGLCAKKIHDYIPPPAIPNVELTADDRPRVIGLFEGAGRWNCGVFRPAPVCKMRNQIWKPVGEAPTTVLRVHFRLCFVCRYTIVNEVNPMRHPELDLLYPGREA